MFGTTLTTRWNWQKLFSYGEVVCFISAWAVGLLVAMQGEQPHHDRIHTRNFASATDSLAINTNLQR